MKLDADLLAEWKELFEHYDKDHNGTIDQAEFAQLCVALGGGFDAQELQVGFEAIDVNGNGVIEFSEFVDWWKNQL